MVLHEVSGVQSLSFKDLSKLEDPLKISKGNEESYMFIKIRRHRVSRVSLINDV